MEFILAEFTRIILQSKAVILVLHTTARMFSLRAHNILQHYCTVGILLRHERSHLVFKIIQSQAEPTVPCPDIVIDRSTVCTESHRTTLLEYGFVAVHHIFKYTGIVVKYNRETLSGNCCCGIFLILSNGYLHITLSDIGKKSRLCSTLQKHLLLHLRIPFIGPWHVFLQKQLNLYKILLVCSKIRLIELKFETLGSARSNIHIRHEV